MDEDNVRYIKRSRHYKAPVMLDHRIIKRIGLGIIAAILVVFAGGYYLGSQGAFNPDAHAPAESVLGQTAPGHDIYQLDSRAPLLVTQIESINVDMAVERPDPLLAVEKPEASEEPVLLPREDSGTAAEDSVAPRAINTEDRRATNLIKQAATLLEPVMEKHLGPPVPDTQTDTQLPAADIRPVDQPMASSSRVKQPRYSIQVGMFKRLDNAEKQVELLKMTGLDAYLIEFTNKQDQLRYNVRLGYFSDKPDAQAALESYISNRGGSGYVVYLSDADRARIKNSMQSDSNNLGHNGELGL